MSVMPESLTLSCPKCGSLIALDETLAGPLIAQVKADAELRVRQSEDALSSRQQEIQAQEVVLAARARQLSEQEANIAAKVNQRLADERIQIQDEARKMVRAELAPEVEADRSRLKNLQRELEQAQKAELALRNDKLALEARENALELEVARKIDEQRSALKEQAEKVADDKARQRLAEKDKLIERLNEQARELQRKAEVGSQQLQGDVLEIDFEAGLKHAFPQDLVEPVKAGARGGDIFQKVLGNMGRPIGTVLWETKRAQAWGADWCSKAKSDAAAAKAEIVVIVSDVLPRGLCDFGPQDGVWVVRPSHAVALAIALRNGLMATAEARQSAVGRETKEQRLYTYLTGPDFRAVIEGIALPFQELTTELDSEKRTTLARWKRQERRIERVLSSVAGFQGDLTGIAGSEMPELPGFEADTADSTL